MIREAVVIAVSSGTATVRFDLDCAPDSCSGCKICAGSKPTRSMDVAVTTTTELERGGIVKIDVCLPDRGHVALLVFGLPLTLALIGGWLGLSFSEHLAISGGVVGLGLGFGIVWFIEHYTSLLKPTAKLMENS